MCESYFSEPRNIIDDLVAASASRLTQLTSECERDGLTVGNSERIAAELARMFGVKQEEVGILKLEKDSLVFAHPAKLHNVGRIPLNSPAIAAHTAHSKRPETINNFTHTRHATFFEMVDVNARPGERKSSKNELTIQKLMSAPVIQEARVVGVIQVCRKGATPQDAGADFTSADLQNLMTASAALAKCFK
jgi:hypothetical protein